MARPLMDTAAERAFLRYNPSREALADLLRAARERRQQSIRAGKSYGALTLAAAERARPEVQQAYAQAQKEAAAAHNVVAPVLAALQGSPLAAGAESERAAQAERMAASQAHQEGDVAAREQAAREYPAYAARAAEGQFNTERNTISNKFRSLLENEGLSASEERTKMSEQQAKERKEEAKERRREEGAERRSLRSDQTAKEGHQLTRESSREAHGGTRNGSKPPTRKELQTAVNTIGTIRQIIGKHGGHLSRGEAVALLSEGKPSETVKEANGETFKTKAIPKFPPNALMAAALDWAEKGRVSRNTVARLRREGYDPSKLGIPLPRTGTAGKVERGAGKVGRQVAKALEG